MSLRIFRYLVFILLTFWLSAFIAAPYIFRSTYFSPVLYDREHKILSAKVSRDGQWRFPVTRELNEKYTTCVKVFEDRRFDFHVGIDPLSVSRALVQNIKSQKIISGGSTITMQLARLLLHNPSRTLWNKIKECWYAVGIEFSLPKSEILKYYAAVAPFGGNTVGIEAAMWRYFQRNSNELSWAESALLAVLPNQPSAIHLEKNRSVLLKKRNDLLMRLRNGKCIDDQTYELSLLEPIPDKIYPVPQIANLLLEFLINKYPDKTCFNSTLDGVVQEKFMQSSRHHAAQWIQNEIHNLCILLVNNSTKEIISYIGNNPDTSSAVRNGKVNNIHRPRSSGSILKPILYAAALDRGMTTPQALLPDIPTLIAGFRPENFSRIYAGAVPAKQCIQKSLNVPSVKLLQAYGLELFYKKLQECGFNDLFRPSQDYGLSLILGGAEVTAWDLARAYSGFAKQLLDYNKLHNDKIDDPGCELKLLVDDEKEILNTNSNEILSVGAIYEMIQAMKGTDLPDFLVTNFYERNKKKIAWKTGTSFGFKDAWCVGITPEYTLVVWVGNSSGMGRPGLIGVYSAAPLLFELFQALTITGEWLQPFDELTKVSICRQSGYPPGILCLERDTLWLPSDLHSMQQCPFHQKIFLDSSLKYRVYQECELYPVAKNWFTLPPVMEYYYKLSHPEYKVMPALRKDCIRESGGNDKIMEFIYPDKGIEVFIPVDLDGLSNKVVLKATHKNEKSKIFWFFDDKYLGSTINGLHELSIDPELGIHYLRIVDDAGQSASATIHCFRRM